MKIFFRSYFYNQKKSHKLKIKIKIFIEILLIEKIYILIII